MNRRSFVPGETVYQLGYVVRAGNAPANTTRFIASTDGPDRYDDIVDQSTWKLDTFKANPVAPWGHDYSIPPVGRVIDVSPADHRLDATIQWDTAATNPLGQLVAAQFADGFLNAVSIGFRPGRQVARSQLAKDDARYKEAGYGMVFYDNELLEISPVVIPANAGALAQRGLPAMRLTDHEVREVVAAELIRLLVESDDVRRLLDVHALAFDAPKARTDDAIRRTFGLG